ncbi:hypothetical protein [Rhizobium leguminosarum]|uniref:hypothetical protein n=1 Tax=Rhizobium leguminosarum TaxID=384 RepID=UPI0014419D9A|nr:hypothetical protein [Rhizobium leguminosarum]NKL56247.1 hypothetical protein [Rhizobium leguminosarum bv. viciae]
METITDEAAALATARRAFAVSEENQMSYAHGRGWSLQHSADPDVVSDMQEMRVELSVSFSDIVDHDIRAIDRFIVAFANAHERQVLSSVIDVVSESSERTGNIVDSGGDIEGGMLEALKLIQFGVDRHGRPTAPVMVVHPELARKLTHIEANQTEEQREVWEHVVAERERQATVEEAVRISRFRWKP